MTARSDDEIRADLATEEGRGSLRRLSPTGRLVADVPELLDSRERAIRRAVTLEGQLAEIQAVIADEYWDWKAGSLLADRLRAVLTGSTE